MDLATAKQSTTLFTPRSKLVLVFTNLLNSDLDAFKSLANLPLHRPAKPSLALFFASILFFFQLEIKDPCRKPLSRHAAVGGGTENGARQRAGAAPGHLSCGKSPPCPSNSAPKPLLLISQHIQLAEHIGDGLGLLLWKSSPKAALRATIPQLPTNKPRPLLCLHQLPQEQHLLPTPLPP